MIAKLIHSPKLCGSTSILVAIYISRPAVLDESYWLLDRLPVGDCADRVCVRPVKALDDDGIRLS